MSLDYRDYMRNRGPEVTWSDVITGVVLTAAIMPFVVAMLIIETDDV
jgi:hypothetical protein